MGDFNRVTAEDGSPARERFARQGYAMLPGLLDPALTAYLWSYAHTRFASLLLPVGDRQVPRTPFAYGDPAFDALLEYVRPSIEDHSGRGLLPTYSYFRIYKHGDALMRHRDRAACEISLSLNIGQEPQKPWPLHIEGQNGTYSADLLPGDGLLYRGTELFHWREPFEGNHLVQVFLHYVDRHGVHADLKFDKRKALMTTRLGETEDAAS